MHYTQNQKIEQVTLSTLVIGVDIGSRVQYARAFDWRGRELTRKAFKFMNSQDGFKQFYEWICQYMAETGLDNVIVGLEPTGHYWFPLAQFLESTQIKLALVNPLHVKQSKELDDGSQTKNDSKDPKVIAKLVKDGRYTVPYLPKGVYADLRIAWKVRESISKSLTANKNKLKRWFATYFPEYMEVFGNLEAKSSLLLLHQASLKIVSFIGKLLKAQEKTLFLSADYGNTGQSSIPLMLADQIENEKIKRIVGCGFGAGFSHGTVLLERKNDQE